MYGERHGMQKGKEKGKEKVTKKIAPGMSYDEAKGKLKKLKIAQHNPATRSSLINQVKLREGDEAAKALDKETGKFFKTAKVLNAMARNESIQHNDNGTFSGWGEGTLNKGRDLTKDGYKKIREGVYRYTF